MLDKRGRPFTARYYRPEDRASLEAMYAAFEPLRAAQGLPPEGSAARAQWLDHVLRLGLHLVVEMDDRLVGHVLLVPFPDDASTAELANFLHQSVRNRGIGTALNRLVIRMAAELGYHRVWLSVEPSNRAAIRSYERAGFRRLPGSLWAPELEMEVRFAQFSER
jgi:RimJ/RimL family protein N-acetyltransferase